MKHHIKSISLVLLLSLSLFGCNTATTSSEPIVDTTSSEEITIVYTNDIHGYIANVSKDSDGNEIDGLRLSKVTALVNEMKDNGKNVLLVDAGDEVQGDIYGAMDEGETVISIMNAAGYDLATPGNHDFDYGMFRFMQIVDKANFDYISCNFKSTETQDTVFPASKIFDIGGKKIAFIGITTPETMSTTSPAYFQNASHEYIYSIDGQNNPEELYESVQNAIDEVRDTVDVVIALGHIGVGLEAESAKMSSEFIIANTSGLDAFIDGHSHTVIEDKRITDLSGHDVVLTQTGCYLENVGMMTISTDGTIQTELISNLETEDETIARLEKEWITNVNDQLNIKVAELENTLYINNPENENERWIRAKEMNLGDIAADSMYWYFNEYMNLNCDIALTNGGGLRAQIEPGDITYISAKQVEPYGNMICLIKANGQEILDALEMGVTEIGIWDDEWNTPAENGKFMQVAGIKYVIDATYESSVEKTESGEFAGVNGQYRIKDIEVYNKESHEYEPLDLEKEYNLAGPNYFLRNGGDGLTMFMDNEGIVDYVGEDYIILAEYFKSFDGASYPVIHTENSPLASYSGYLLDYENPLGSGRITDIFDEYIHLKNNNE